MKGIKRVVTLKEVCLDFIVPQRDKPTAFEGDIPWCRIEDIEGRYLNRSKSGRKVTKELADKMNMHMCPKGTVISACSASIGNQAITTTDCYTNQTFIGLVVNPKMLDNVYLYYFLESQTKSLLNLGQGATIKYISKDKYKAMLIPLPSLSEQQAIVSRLDSAFAQVDALKANAEKQLEEARKLFQAELKESMKPKEGWEEKTLGDICKTITDGTHHSPVNTSEGRFKYITAKNIKTWGLDLSNITFVSEDVHKEIIARCCPEKGDVLYIKDGATTGIAIVNPLEEQFSLLSSVALLKPDKDKLSSAFLCYALNSPVIYVQTRNQMDGAAITRVTLVKIKSFVIPLPSLKSQQEIVSRLDALSANVKRLEELQQKTLKECDALKQAMLREVFE